MSASIAGLSTSVRIREMGQGTKYLHVLKKRNKYYEKKIYAITFKKNTALQGALLLFRYVVSLGVECVDLLIALFWHKNKLQAL